jgi:hypothetical protein
MASSLCRRAVFGLFEGFGDGGELGESCGEVFDDYAGDDLGRKKAVGVLQARVFQPGDVEIDLVAGYQLVVAERLEPLGLDTVLVGSPGR